MINNKVHFISSLLLTIRNVEQFLINNDTWTMHIVYPNIFVQNSVCPMHNIQAIFPIKIGVFDSLFTNQNNRVVLSLKYEQGLIYHRMKKAMFIIFSRIDSLGTTMTNS